MNIYTDHTRRLLERYELIDEGDFHSCIAFFEHNEEQLRQMDEGLFMAIYEDFLDSLYRAGHYDNLYERCDLCLQHVLSSDREFDQERYIALLYRKAYCAHYTLQWEQAQKLLEAVLKLDTGHIKAQKLYALTQKRRLKARHKWIYAIVILQLLAMTGVLLMEIFVFDTFIERFETQVSWIRHLLLLSALGSLLGFELWTTLSGKWKLRQRMKLVEGTSNP